MDIEVIGLTSLCERNDNRNLFYVCLCVRAVTLADIFKLEFRVRENDNDTNWVERLSNVGSDGTDVLVKAMVNIMLINVFKKKVSKRFGDFRIHCMMDLPSSVSPSVRVRST